MADQLTVLKAKTTWTDVERKWIIARVEELDQDFGNLMAVINGDGGHRAGDFSSRKEAGEDAQKTVVASHARIEELEREKVLNGAIRFEEALDRAAEVAVNEPEPSMEVPPELAKWSRADIARAAIRATKKSIAAAILDLKETT